MRRVCVVGLDGATWDLLLPLAREGFLPVLRKLIEGGSYGELESTIPPITAPAWASFATGKNPGKTGIFDFLLPKGSLEDLVAITSKDIYGKTFYEILEENGKRTIIINLPLSYPPRTTSPTITSIMTQGKQFIFPADLKDKMPELEAYRLTPNFNLKVDGREEEYFQDIRELEKQRFICAQKLFQLEWDFFFCLFSGIDWIQHELYDKLASNSLSKSHPSYQLYKDIDSYIGWFVDHLSGETSILLMSDHGFRAYKGVFFVNRWLSNNGFLTTQSFRKRNVPYQHLFAEGLAKAKLRKTGDKALSGRVVHLALPGSIERIFRRFGFYRIYRVLAKRIPIYLQTGASADYARTSALCTTSELSGVYLNSTERYRDGIVNSIDAGRIKNEIIAELKRLKDPVTGEAAFDRVLDSREVYSGERTKLAPDILILPRNYWVSAGLYSDRELFSRSSLNNHDSRGIFLLYGNGIKKGSKLDGASICDIAPTVFHILGIPIPRDVDGMVLKAVFEDDSEFAGRSVEYMRTDDREKIRDRIDELKRLKEI